jgi:DNA gyrase subunit A
MPVINYINILGGERVTATVSVKDIQGEGFLTMITRHGEVKRTPLNAFSNIRNNGLIAFDIEEGDELGWAHKTRGSDDLILVTHHGQSIRFDERKATSRSRAAGGVRAMTLKPGDIIQSSDVIRDGASLLVVSEHGYGKRTELGEYRVQGRGGSGILTMNCTAKTGFIVGAEVVEEDDRLLVMTVNGKGIRLRVKEIRTTGRVAQGVKLIDLASKDAVRSIARIVQEEDDGEIEGGEEAEGTGETTE